MLRWLFGSAVAAVCWGAIGTASAFAHAPLARAVAVGREGTAIALRMPGFGLLVRAPGDERFAYACDALLGWTPEDMQAPFAYLAGGELLVGTAHGLRAFTPSGCPAAESVRPIFIVRVAQSGQSILGCGAMQALPSETSCPSA